MTVPAEVQSGDSALPGAHDKIEQPYCRLVRGRLREHTYSRIRAAVVCFEYEISSISSKARANRRAVSLVGDGGNADAARIANFC